MKLELAGWTVEAAQGVVSKKWSLLIIRAIGMQGLHRFNEILHSAPGITPRMLSKRLKELEREGLILLIVKRPNLVRWDLTAKGWDAIPILIAFAQFGSKWSDRTAANPRTLSR
jgi:DNA-binding HxlR family transcriptional regulator